ncbi:AAA family ATPase, partial [Candidatus Roizmanbacteria bacterium]|nr:AAA family ATPase [Candidatus Roizmanbacteria bacterium]
MTQNQALSIVKTGANVFLTGEPGSGKTHTVNQYIHYLREHGIAVAVTASTGIAATHLGGMTIHSWSGIGIRKEISERDLAALHGITRLVSRVQKTSVLVIDEISMLEARVLSVVDRALRALRENNNPFGGIQVVFVGDFFQLPPVSGKDEQAQFAFESPAWTEANPVVCYLKEQHRQEDVRFTSLLTAVRSGTNSSEDYSRLLTRKVSVNFEGAMTRLYSHNADVDRVNAVKLQALPGDEQVFYMASQGNKALVEQLKKGCLSPEKLTLKKGAHVMFTKNNYEEGFVNGTLGEVVGFEDELPVVMTKQGRKIGVVPMEWSIEENGRVLASITQIPLRLAWAITVHKSQGMTLDSAIIDLSAAFEYGQGYVALSRVRTLSGLFLLGLNERALEVHPEIITAD